MTDIVIKKKNEVYVTIAGAPHIHHELSDYFSFEVPEAKFLKRNPRYRAIQIMMMMKAKFIGTTPKEMRSRKSSGLVRHRMWDDKRKKRSPLKIADGLIAA